MSCGFLTCSLVHDRAPNDSGRMMPKANLLEYPVASKRLSVPREPTSLTRTRTNAHWKATALRRPADSQRLPQVSITDYPSPGFLSLKAPSLRTGWCERSSSCLRWRRRKIAQGDTCLPSSFSQCFWHRQQHFTL